MHPKATMTLAMLALVGVLLGPGSADATASAAMPSDFDGDGYADLAVGAPGETIGTKREAGGVNVLYGSATGLTAGGDQFWSQDSPGVKGVGRASERFGAALASGDFDRDGFADLAISVLREGVVNVLYGSSTGLTAEGDQSWSAAALALSAQISHLAGSLASGDFDGDGCWDLAIEASAVSAVGVDDFDPGRVVVVRGGGDGLRATDPVVLDRSMTRASTPGDVYHTFGSSLAAGDLDGDGDDDLAVGTRFDDDHVAYDDVSVFYGAAGGLSGQGSRAWGQVDIGDARRPWDQFGFSLAIGDFDADGFGDLAVGVPMAQVPSPEESDSHGAVAVIRGSPNGLTAAGNQLWHEDVPGIPSRARGHERFGYALAAGDMDGDGSDDLAIGVPGEGSGASGAVIALYGGASGLTPSGSRIWTQDSSGVPGTREHGDHFGATLAISDFGRSGRADLAVGAPGEDLAGRSDAGVVGLLYGRTSRIIGTDAQSWSQDTAGVKEVPGNGDVFGSSLTP